ncbi:hypothetical protein Bca4012_066935 [Brassica carinata]
MELTERISALSPQERKLISPALNEHLRLPMISTQGMSMGAKQEAGTGKTEEKKEKTVFGSQGSERVCGESYGGD